MSIKFKQMLFELTEQLSFINIELDDSIAKSEKSVQVSLLIYNKLKKQFLKEKSISDEFQIDFFKNVKPKFTSLYIYHNAIYKIIIFLHFYPHFFLFYFSQSSSLFF